MTKITSASDEVLQEAADILKAGGLVSIPTETVYGLAANAFDDKAVARVYEAKGRPSFNPLIVHYPKAPSVQGNPWYEIVSTQFWPGPLTLVVPAFEPRISALATAGLDTVAIRVPAHPVAQKLLKLLDFPLVAPSANASGSLSPTTPAHVAESLGDKIDLVLAGGACKVGLESTVLDISGEKPVILRPGAITAQDLSELLAQEIMYEHNASQIKSPGQLLKHYAPNTPLRLHAVDVGPDEALLAFGSLKFMGIKNGGFAKNLPEDQVLNLSEQGDLQEAAANLFSMLQILDKRGFARIAVMNIPDIGLGVAINDRLKRAAC